MEDMEGGTMNSNYDGQGKSLEQETHGAMLAAVVAVGISLMVWGIVGYIVWRAIAG